MENLRNPSLSKSLRKIEPVEVRFWKMVDKSAGPDSCWLWLGRKTEGGYGHLQIELKKRRAHRIAYILTSGPIPKEIMVLHSCDNPPCCNPKHLFLGTHDDNMKDRSQKQRSPNLKLSDEEVRELLTLHQTGKYYQWELAKKFHVTRRHVGKLVQRLARKHLVIS